ncbi:hypothetical protein K490DRAFT_63888 [Saccharata proteae CBS 121410]|uniref:Uncharacterized protein n=1 Tax=Saccharata proteae CBS 121410 TaxID=1314787 RepID=A0A6A5YG06_9PEZI|nr:hypothetical protein K490DRAFT_63888 [Saccharata proteae CBS 121410]
MSQRDDLAANQAAAQESGNVTDTPTLEAATEPNREAPERGSLSARTGHQYGLNKQCLIESSNSADHHEHVEEQDVEDQDMSNGKTQERGVRAYNMLGERCGYQYGIIPDGGFEGFTVPEILTWRHSDLTVYNCSWRISVCNNWPQGELTAYMAFSRDLSLSEITKATQLIGHGIRKAGRVISGDPKWTWKTGNTHASEKEDISCRDWGNCTHSPQHPRTEKKGKGCKLNQERKHTHDYSLLEQALKVPLEKYPSGTGARTWTNIMRWVVQNQDFEGVAELKNSDIAGLLTIMPELNATSPPKHTNLDKVCLEEWKAHPSHEAMRKKAKIAHKWEMKKVRSDFKGWTIDEDAVLRLEALIEADNDEDDAEYDEAAFDEEQNGI